MGYDDRSSKNTKNNNGNVGGGGGASYNYSTINNGSSSNSGNSSNSNSSNSSYIEIRVDPQNHRQDKSGEENGANNSGSSSKVMMIPITTTTPDSSSSSFSYTTVSNNNNNGLPRSNLTSTFNSSSSLLHHSGSNERMMMVQNSDGPGGSNNGSGIGISDESSGRRTDGRNNNNNNKKKRQVRFSKDNNPQSLEVHFPTDEMSIDDYGHNGNDGDDHDYNDDNDDSYDFGSDEEEEDDGVLTMTASRLPFDKSKNKNKRWPEPSKSYSEKQHSSDNHQTLKAGPNPLNNPFDSSNAFSDFQDHDSNHPPSSFSPSLPSVTVTPSDQKHAPKSSTSPNYSPGYSPAYSPGYLSPNHPHSMAAHSMRPSRPMYRRNNSSNTNVPRSTSRYLPENAIYVPVSRSVSPVPNSHNNNYYHNQNDLYLPSPGISRPASTNSLIDYNPDHNNNSNQYYSINNQPSSYSDPYPNASSSAAETTETENIRASQLAHAREIIAARSVSGIGTSSTPSYTTEDITNSGALPRPAAFGPSSQIAASSSVTPNYFDIGLITPGGLVPGAVPQYTDERAKEHRSRDDNSDYHDFPSNNANNNNNINSINSLHGYSDNPNSNFNSNFTSGSNSNNSNSNSNFNPSVNPFDTPRECSDPTSRTDLLTGGPYGQGISEHDIPLEELHNRLSQIAKKRNEKSNSGSNQSNSGYSYNNSNNYNYNPPYHYDDESAVAAHTMANTLTNSGTGAPKRGIIKNSTNYQQQQNNATPPYYSMLLPTSSTYPSNGSSCNSNTNYNNRYDNDNPKGKGKIPPRSRSTNNGNRIEEENEDIDDSDDDQDDNKKNYPSGKEVAQKFAQSLVRAHSTKHTSEIKSDRNEHRNQKDSQHGINSSGNSNHHNSSSNYRHHKTSSIGSVNSDSNLLGTSRPTSPNPFNAESRNSSLVAIPTAAIFSDKYYYGDRKEEEEERGGENGRNQGQSQNNQSQNNNNNTNNDHGNDSGNNGTNGEHEHGLGAKSLLGGLKKICDDLLDRNPPNLMHPTQSNNDSSNSNTSSSSSDSDDTNNSTNNTNSNTQSNKNNSHHSQTSSSSTNESSNSSTTTLNDPQAQNYSEDWVPPPKHVKQGILGSLLKLYNSQQKAADEAAAEAAAAAQAHSSYHSNKSLVSMASSGYGDRLTPGNSGTHSPDGRPSSLKSRASSFENLSHALLHPKSGGSNNSNNKHDKSHKKKWSLNLRSQNASTSSLAELVSSSNSMLGIPHHHNSYSFYDKGRLHSSLPASPSASGTVTPILSLPDPDGGDGAKKGGKHQQQPQRPKYNRQHSAIEAIKRAQNERKRRKRLEKEEMRITLHIADVLQRQRFILRLCRALMLFGAPTHRLEEYMIMTSRALNIDGQFIYIPGCMIASFGDSTTHTSEVQLVRVIQGVNLTKLQEVHQIYKNVIHLHTKLDIASDQIDELLRRKNLYSPWLCVLIFAISSACVGPFGFGATWVDMPLCFLVGGSVGLLQIIVAPRSGLYNNVFEVTASIIVSFMARAFGSIRPSNPVFCFPAIVQSSLALILPGYIILCGSLELQSRNIVAGSVRMFYAIIYSMLLGFGITLGAAIYGWFDKSATSATTCPNALSPYWRFLFVPLFTTGLALVNQASLRQLPVMILISGASYASTYFANRKLANATELTSAIGAFVIGILGNMYSRVGHGLAFAAMLPAIFVQVPSGVAAQGSLISGIASANSIVSNVTDPAVSLASSLQSMGVGLTMVQVSIGMCVGLFVATLCVYPFGKKMSGLFTF